MEMSATLTVGGQVVAVPVITGLTKAELAHVEEKVIVHTLVKLNSLALKRGNDASPGGAKSDVLFSFQVKKDDGTIACDMPKLLYVGMAKEDIDFATKAFTDGLGNIDEPVKKKISKRK